MTHFDGLQGSEVFGFACRETFPPALIRNGTA